MLVFALSSVLIIASTLGISALCGAIWFFNQHVEWVRFMYLGSAVVGCGSFVLLSQSADSAFYEFVPPCIVLTTLGAVVGNLVGYEFVRRRCRIGTL